MKAIEYNRKLWRTDDAPGMTQWGSGGRTMPQAWLSEAMKDGWCPRHDSVRQWRTDDAPGMTQWGNEGRTIPQAWLSEAMKDGRYPRHDSVRQWICNVIMAVSDTYPMFIEPTITRIPSRFSGYIWYDLKIVLNKYRLYARTSLGRGAGQLAGYW